MTIVIKKTDSPEEAQRKIDRFLKKRKEKPTPKQGFDPYKYLGKLKGVFGDGLEYQKKMRDEWER
jgi:hypothetical protein